MAGSMNKVLLIGRLGRDPEMRFTAGGRAVANFTMATDESFTGKDGNRETRTEWHRVVVWGKQAETVNNYLGKGRLVFVEGSLQTRKWTDKNNQEQRTTEINAQRVLFLDSKGGQESGTTYPEPPPPGDEYAAPTLPEDDDIPF